MEDVDDPMPVAATREDPVAAALDRFGGPAGRHARGHWWWTPTRVALACVSVLFALAIVQHEPCISTSWNNTQVRYQKMCYSDVPYLYTTRGLAEQHWPYTAGGRYPGMEYPVGISYFAWVASALTHLDAPGPPEAVRANTSVSDLWGLPGMGEEVNIFFVVNAVLLCGCALAATYFLARTDRRRPWDALGFALSPALLLTGLVNWDLLAAVCVAGALWAWARRRPMVTGLFIGLGTAAKLYPLLLLGVFGVVALRGALKASGSSRGRERVKAVLAGAEADDVLRMCVAAIASWVLLQVPAWLSDVDKWKTFWGFNSHRGADLGSLWLLFSQSGAAASTHAINVVSWLLVALACLGVLVIGLRAPARPRPAQLGYLLVMAFLIVNKVYSPQYVLWLLPLAVLARPKWRDLLIWQACELVYVAGVWAYLGGWLAPASGSAPWPYHVAILVRVVGELYLAGMIVRDLWRPEHDPVARTPRPLPELEPAAETPC